MSTLQADRPSIDNQLAPALSLAGRFLEALAAQDFDRLADTLVPTVELRTLLPRGHVDWSGAGPVADRFRIWFGDTDDFELLDATIGQVGGRVQLRWRIRLRAERLGPGDFTVEQQVYADAEHHEGLTRIDLLCSGYRPTAGSPSTVPDHQRPSGGNS